ncbi:esterase-like activity of phytase family protein, partial [Sandarakinorhabdus rubra]|uniref:esterase-like activity of phytase family protein n=1 Tax=Sandarakinorhabdus rubra TaxID=2672568 RepID=UPI0013DAC99B
ADGATRTLAIPGLPGFSPTDAAPLPDGRLLLLHRLYNGVSNAAAITLVDLPAIRAGRPAPGRLLARWGREGPWPVDNMEGLALTREQGQPVLYVVSDNNFSGLQRTLLMRLVIAAPLDGQMP